MAKIKKRFVCSQCGNTSIKWIGHCPNCEGWNTYQEEYYGGNPKQPSIISKKAVSVAEIGSYDNIRIDTKNQELNRVLGGGIVPGSVILIAGNPGIGKSTLLLQILLSQKKKTLYVSAEESLQQIKMRADRLGALETGVKIFSGYKLEEVIQIIDDEKPSLAVIDSVQALQSHLIDAGSGSVTQIRYVTEAFQQIAKEKDIPIILIGHITKEGTIAGPKLLEHIVDVVLQFEGDRHNNYRLLRVLKNRFGSTQELAIFEMKGNGLVAVSDPSDILLSQGDEALSGSSIAASLEGVRPLMAEIQALVSTTVYSTPQRSSTGFDLRRLNMLLAVLEKRGGLPLFKYDVFLNLAGGIRITDPALDLSVATSLASSLYDIPVSKSDCFAAEIGLSGEIRVVSQVEKRISEATRLGFKRIFLSKYTKGLKSVKTDIEIIKIGRLEDLLAILFT